MRKEDIEGIVGAKRLNRPSGKTIFLCVVILAFGASELFLRGALDGTFLGSSTEVSGFKSEASSRAIWGMIATAVLVAPIVEELVFRGILLTQLASRIGTGPAVLVVSALFSLVHFGYASVDKFLFSIFLCLIYIGSRTLILPIVLHAVSNFIPIFSWSAGVDLRDYSHSLFSMFGNPAVIAAGTSILIYLAVSVYLGLWCAKIQRKDERVLPYYAFMADRE